MNPELKIRKASAVIGHALTLRDAGPQDAEFILRIRQDPRNSKYLSTGAVELEAQIRWLKEYADADDQAYFIIVAGSSPIGTVRLYDQRGNSFCWGSWIIADGAPARAATESALMVYSYGLDVLRFSGAHFDVRRANERVVEFHRRFGAEQIGETEANYSFSICEDRIRASIARYKKFLPDGIRVECA